MPPPGPRSNCTGRRPPRPAARSRRTRSPGTAPSSLLAASSTSYTDSRAQPGTTYTYTVTAIDAIGAPSTPGQLQRLHDPRLPFRAALSPIQCMAHLPAGLGRRFCGAQCGCRVLRGRFGPGDVAAFGGATCYGAMTGPSPQPSHRRHGGGSGYGRLLARRHRWRNLLLQRSLLRARPGPSRLNRPIVGMASTANGSGYWLVATDGAPSPTSHFYGSTGNLRLNRPVVGMAARSGHGRLLVGGHRRRHVLASPMHPSMAPPAAIRLNQPVVGMAAVPDGTGYRLVASDGGVFCFNQPFFGSTGAIPPEPTDGGRPQ